MKFRLKRQWWPLLGAMGAYISWDLIDQMVLQPRSTVLGGYLIDWGVAGLIGLTTFYVVQQRRKHANGLAVDDQAWTRINPSVINQIAAASRALDETLDDLHGALGDSIGSEGLPQQRYLRQAMVATHHAQSLVDEITGLVATPKVAAPPAEQLMMHQPH